MKLATQVGIGFHVLTDGDEAGRKYAEITAEFLKGKKKDSICTENIRRVCTKVSVDRPSKFQCHSLLC